MSSIMDMVMEQLQSGGVQQLSQMLGADENSVGSAVSAAVPVLMQALANNASNPDGASSLFQALDRDHDGSIFDDIAGFLANPQAGNGNPRAGNGAGILGHVLGGHTDSVAAGLSQGTGLNVDTVSRLLQLVAPIVMGALGKSVRQEGLDANGLASMLGEQTQAAAAQSSNWLGLVSSFLDADKDGSALDDVAGLVGRFFSNR
ncbi:MAG: DUF937 domain-containing protein [Acidobacteriota bacterium]|nr:DUF937 domain-containing protein [Blastocatellia bacterium]MDW8239097.1 DUF937 domain-containing protein [Acidobacteriota bacterium]